MITAAPSIAEIVLPGKAPSELTGRLGGTAGPREKQQRCCGPHGADSGDASSTAFDFRPGQQECCGALVWCCSSAAGGRAGSISTDHAGPSAQTSVENNTIPANQLFLMVRPCATA